MIRKQQWAYIVKWQIKCVNVREACHDGYGRPVHDWLDAVLDNGFNRVDDHLDAGDRHDYAYNDLFLCGIQGIKKSLNKYKLVPLARAWYDRWGKGRDRACG